MNILFLLIPLSVLVALLFLAAFFWAVRDGQYDDTCTPSLRVLTDEAADCRSPKISPTPPDPKASNR